MQIQELLTDDAVMGELGGRLEQHRLARDRTQAQLAEQAGVGRATIQRLEAGQSVQLVTLVRVLRALDLLDGLNVAVPERAVPSPIVQLERELHIRKRVRPSPGRDNDEASGAGERPWTWGEQVPGSGA